MSIKYYEQELVERIQAVFSRVLECNITDVDVNKSFFAQGGTSLKALQALALLQQNITTQINPQSFFDCPTVARLARAVLSDQSDFPETTTDVYKT